ncbi:MAG: glycosyltransferase [Candidatus Longimicrobiales bacterium M2_2A_002]
MPRVSILMPCRDAAEHIDAAIASIRGQTFADFEVVAVDDGSTDGTFDRLCDWAGRDGRVRPLQGHGRGLVPSLATALATAQGEIVARMDADDIAAPTRLQKQVALLDDDPRIAACGTGVIYFPETAVRDGARRYETWINGLVTHDEIARGIFVECPIPHPTLMIRRHVLLAVGGYRELGWPEDYDLVLRVWAAGYRLGKVPEVLLRWREYPERASRTDARYGDVEFRRIKIFFLQHTLLAPDRHAVVWGAGPIGKTLARELADAGTRIAAFVDVDPNKIGQEIHGAPVIRPAEVGELVERYEPPGADGPTHPLVLGAVGQEGAREEIRAECRRQGLTELADFVMVA